MKRSERNVGVSLVPLCFHCLCGGGDGGGSDVVVYWRTTMCCAAAFVSSAFRGFSCRNRSWCILSYDFDCCVSAPSLFCSAHVASALLRSARVVHVSCCCTGRSLAMPAAKYRCKQVKSGPESAHAHRVMVVAKCWWCIVLKQKPRADVSELAIVATGRHRI